MDNYKLMQRLGKGAQGAVFLVEHREDKRHYVLKKVECNDESEANKAFKEAMALQELRHEFVCGYKEFFVTWDKEECAMFVCIVMDYYEMGDLAKIIKTKRVKKESIDEMILKKWLGQMVEALVFVHKKQVIHRDLKPSNIFITKSLSITIGDFGVATVMGDARTRTRTTVGSMNWMAPEVMERPYDERSDVWSLGCIILELATCGFLDPVQISSSLFEIKQNPQCLEDILCELPKYKYSANLCQLIRTMLRRNFHQRPTAIELVTYPFVRECLLLLPTSKLVEKKKQQFQKYDPLPTNKGIGAVFLYMKNNFENEEAQKHVFKYLETNTKIAKFCLSINKSMKKQLVQTMESCLECSSIQLSGCRTVLNLIENGDQSEILYTTDMIKPILLAMRCHSTSYELQSTACSLLMALSADEDAAEVIGEAGGVQDILAVMRQFPSKAEICANCCATLWSLSVNESNARIVTEEKGLQDVCNAFEAHSGSTSLVEAACSAIWSLSLEDDNLGTLTDVAIPLVVECMQTHMSKMKVVKSALMALASIVTCAEECAYKVISPSKDVVGLQVILDACNAHSREVDIAESLCSVILELSEYDDIVQELKIPSLKTVEILTTMRKRYPGNEEISGGTEILLSKLGGGKNIGKRPMSSKARPRSAARNR